MSKANNILILGNGFDLSIGLNSKFVDYISDIFQKKNIGLSEITKCLEKYNGEERLIALYSIYHLKNKDLEDFIKNNWLIFLCFYETKNLKELDWADVEKMLTEYIVSIDYLNDIPLRCMAEYKHRLSPLYPKYGKSNASFKIDLDEITKHINKFTDSFVEYIKNEISKNENQSKVDDKIEEFKASAWKKLSEILNIVSPGNNWRYPVKGDTYILNFNYTNWFQNWRDQNGFIFSNFNVNNIHGSIEQKSKCIIGIDDKKINLSMDSVDLHKNHLTNQYVFSKTYKRLCNCNYDLDLSLSNNNEIKTNIIFCGLSLSENDQIYYESIFNKYNIYDNKQVYIYFIFFKGHELFPKIYRLLKKYGESFDNKLQGNTLITQLSIEGRLKIVEFS